jgi:hypothetical protein
MVELLIFSGFGGLLLLLHFLAAVIYKVRTKSKKSVLYIMDHII